MTEFIKTEHFDSYLVATTTHLELNLKVQTAVDRFGGVPTFTLLACSTGRTQAVRGLLTHALPQAGVTVRLLGGDRMGAGVIASTVDDHLAALSQDQ